MKNISQHLATLLITAWVGGLWAIGYLAVPVLFYAQPDRQLAGMLAGQMFTLIIQCGIQPVMTGLKQQALPADVMHSVFADRFKMLHGISSIAYLIESLLGAFLVIKTHRA